MVLKVIVCNIYMVTMDRSMVDQGNDKATNRATGQQGSNQSNRVIISEAYGT